MKVGVRELRNNLSRYLGLVHAGDEVVVTDHGREIARVVPIAEEAGSDEAKRLWRGVLAHSRRSTCSEASPRSTWPRPSFPGTTVRSCSWPATTTSAPPPNRSAWRLSARAESGPTRDAWRGRGDACACRGRADFTGWHAVQLGFRTVAGIPVLRSRGGAGPRCRCPRRARRCRKGRGVQPRRPQRRQRRAPPRWRSRAWR